MTHASNRSNVAAASCAAVLALALYVATCAPGVLWGDSGTYQVRVARGPFESPLGLALTHPLYMHLAKAFAALPLGEVAYRVNLFSAVCAAAAIGLLHFFLFRATGSKWAAAIGCALLAVSHTFWTHAVMAEVYTLYALGLAVELCLIQQHLAVRRDRWLLAALFINGLNACNHLLALLHLPTYGILLLWRAAARVDPVEPTSLRMPAPTGTASDRFVWLVSRVIMCATAWMCGASLYIAAIAANIGARGDAWTVIQEALTGRSYARQMVGGSFSIIQQIVRTAQCFALNVPTPLVLLAVPALIFACRRSTAAVQADRTVDAAAPPSKTVVSRAMVRFLVGIFSVNLAFGLVYRVPDQYVFFFPAYVTLAMLVGIGCRLLSSVSSDRWGMPLCLAMALLPAVVYELAPGLCRHYQIGLRNKRQLVARDEYVYFLRPRKNGENSAQAFCRSALQTAGPGAFLLADSTIKSPLVYVRDVLGVGQEVILESAWFSEVTPAPPIAANTAAVRHRYANDRGAFLCDVTPGYFDPAIEREFSFTAVGPIWRLTPCAVPP